VSEALGGGEELGIIAEEEEVREIKKRYGRLLPVAPDMIFIESSGHFRESIVDVGRAKLHDLVHILRVAGRASVARTRPRISKVVYEIRVRPPKTVTASNTLLEFIHTHSYGQLSMGLESGEVIRDVVIEEYRKAIPLGLPSSEKFVIQASSLGASSLGTAHRIGEGLKKEVPGSFFLDLLQLGSPQAGTPREEVEERVNLAHQVISHRVTNNIKAIVIFPYLSSMRGEVRQREVYDMRLHELLDFFIDLAAYYIAFVKLGREDLLEKVDAELGKAYAQRHIFILSSINYAPTALERVEWLAPLNVVEKFIGEIEERGYIFGIFAMKNMVESVKNSLGHYTIPATGVISPRGESRWILCLEVEEREVKELLRSCVAGAY
jgi:hypothetical protein